MPPRVSFPRALSPDGCSQQMNNICLHLIYWQVNYMQVRSIEDWWQSNPCRWHSTLSGSFIQELFSHGLRHVRHYCRCCRVIRSAAAPVCEDVHFSSRSACSTRWNFEWKTYSSGVSLSFWTFSCISSGKVYRFAQNLSGQERATL